MFVFFHSNSAEPHDMLPDVYSSRSATFGRRESRFGCSSKATPTALDMRTGTRSFSVAAAVLLLLFPRKKTNSSGFLLGHLSLSQKPHLVLLPACLQRVACP